MAGDGLFDQAVLLGEGTTGSVEMHLVGHRTVEGGYQPFVNDAAYLLLGLEEGVYPFGRYPFDQRAVVGQRPVGLGRTAVGK